MDESVLRAMARWPNVPAVFGWLSLDRRGRWRIKGETISNQAAIAFIGRNYAADSRGRWYFQNGPQRVFVQLEAAPWVVRLDPGARFTAHTGAAAGEVHGVYMDEHGAVMLAAALGPALLDDRDLDAFADRLCGAHGEALDQDALLARVEGLRDGAGLGVRLGRRLLGVGFLAAGEAPARLGFVREPQPDSEQETQNA